MPDDKNAVFGRHFAADLRRIRAQKNVSVDDLHNETKIPRGLIESFEQSGLFDHPMFNRVYLRSFIRTYADVVGISPDIAVAALEDAFEGRYDGRLAQEYLGEEASSSIHLEREQMLPATEQPAQTGFQSERVAPASSSVLKQSHKDPLSREPAVAWTAQSPPPSSRSFASDRFASGRSQVKQWIFIGGGLVVLVAAIWWVLRSADGAESQQQSGSEQQEVVLSDSVNLADTSSAGIGTPLEGSLPIGEEFQVTIVAAQDKVQNIKVTVDDDVRRPYWIERDKSRTFRVKERIIIERQLEKIELKVAGRSYPTDQRDDQDRIVITRDQIRSYLAANAVR